MLAALALVLTLVHPAFAADFADTLASARQAREQGDALLAEQDYRGAAGAYEKSLTLYQSIDLRNEIAVVRHQLGFSYLGSGNKEAALLQFEANISYHRERGDREGVANYLLYAGQVRSQLGQYDKAVDYLGEAQQLMAPAPERRAEALQWLVQAHEQAGNSNKARDTLRDAIDELPTDVVQRYLGDARSRLLAKGDSGNFTYLTGAAPWLAVIAMGGIVLWALARARRIRAAVANVLLLTASLAATVGLAEWVLRLAAPPTIALQHFLHTPNRVTEFVPLPGIMPGVDYTHSRFTVNEAGIRGDSLPERGVYRILAIGGSSTEVLFLDDQDAWPRVLQEELQRITQVPVWVGNAGKSGLNTFSHTVQAYYQITELQADAVVVTAGINDLNQCISGGRQAVIDNARFIRHSDFFANYRNYVFDRVEPEPANDAAAQWQLVQLFKRAKESFEATPTPAALRFDHAVQDQAGLLYVDQRQRRQRAQKVETMPDISECLAAFDYNLRLIAKLGRERNVKLVFATQGSLYRDNLSVEEENLLWFGAVDENPFATTPPRAYYTAQVMAQLLAAYNASTLKACHDEQIPCFDTDAAIPQTTASYYDDVHLNIGGSRTLGRTLAQFLKKSGIPSRP